MKIILTEDQLNKIINEGQKVRYFDDEGLGIDDQIEWLIMQKDFIVLQQNSGSKLKLINNIIHNLQKVQGMVGTSSIK